MHVSIAKTDSGAVFFSSENAGLLTYCETKTAWSCHAGVIHNRMGKRHKQGR